MLNQSLAEHYGLAGPRWNGLRESGSARLNKRRGGLLTQVRFCSPIRLARIRTRSNAASGCERLLDDPPAPPPPNVPTLNAENQDFGSSLKGD